MLAKKTRKILSLALVLVMVISMFPMMAMADDEGTECPNCGENLNAAAAGYHWVCTEESPAGQNLICDYDYEHEHSDGNCDVCTEEHEHITEGEGACTPPCSTVPHTHIALNEENSCYEAVAAVYSHAQVADTAKLVITLPENNQSKKVTLTYKDGSHATTDTNAKSLTLSSIPVADIESVWVSYFSGTTNIATYYNSYNASSIVSGADGFALDARTAGYTKAYDHIDVKTAAALTVGDATTGAKVEEVSSVTYISAFDGKSTSTRMKLRGDEYTTDGAPGSGTSGHIIAAIQNTPVTFVCKIDGVNHNITFSQGQVYADDTYYPGNGPRASELAGVGAGYVGSVSGLPTNSKGYYDVSGKDIYQVARRLCDEYTSSGGGALDFALNDTTVNEVIEKAKLEVTKVITGTKPDGWQSHTFTFTVTGETEGYTGVGQSKTVTGEGTAVFEDLQQGYTYIITETGCPAGYTPDGPKTILIEKGIDKVEVDYNNAALDPVKGTLEVTKSVTGLQRGYHTFYFKVKDSAGNYINDGQIFSIRVDVASNGNGSREYSIPNLDPGTYTVEEVDYNGSDYKNYGASSGIEFVESSSTTVVSGIEVVEGGTVKATIINAYRVTPKPGTLTITKTVTGVVAGDYLDEYNFTVIGEGVNMTVPVQMTGNGKASGSSSAISLLPGSYTVSEVTADGVANIDGYTLTTLPINLTATVTIPDGGTRTANFTNAYTKDYGEGGDIVNPATLTINKIDGSGTLITSSPATFTLTNTANPTEVHTFSTVNGIATFTFKDDAITGWETDVARIYELRETVAPTGYTGVSDVIEEITITRTRDDDIKITDPSPTFWKKVFNWLFGTESTTETMTLNVVNDRDHGWLTIKKEFDGLGEGQNADIDISVDIAGPADFNEGGQLTVVLNEDSNWTWRGYVPTGDYTVGEQTGTAGVSGYSLAVSYDSNDDTAVQGTNNITVPVGKTNEAAPTTGLEDELYGALVEITNTYRQDVYPTSYSLTVNHIGVAADGTRTTLGTTTTPGYSLGQNYTSSVGSFTGWTFTGMDVGSAAVSGTINGNTVVTYLYESDTDIPEETDPLGDGVDIPDETDPLGDGIDIPDDLDPLGDAPKTNDSNNIFLLITIMISCAFGLVIINLPRKKRNEV